jgi:DNA-binding transcriptional LysR family regulator
MDYVKTLRIFRAVVEAERFTRAADMMGIATPMVSRAISSLEKRLHSRLFHRSTRQILLTDSSERFYERCTRILEEIDALEAEAQKQTLQPSGVLRVVAHTATMNRLVKLIDSSKTRYPCVELDITLRTSRRFDCRRI